MFDTDLLLAGMEQIASIGAVAIVHAEDGQVIDYLENKLSNRGESTPASFLATRPSIAEVMAIERVAALSRLSGCPVVFGHVSSADGAVRLAELQARQAGLHAETQPHYLVLTDDDLQKHGGMAKVGPPLRSSTDTAAVWEALRSGVVESISSDHVAYERATKESAGPDFLLDTPFGLPGVETMLAVAYTHGVAENRLSLTENGCPAVGSSGTPIRYLPAEGLAPPRSRRRYRDLRSTAHMDRTGRRPPLRSRLHTIRRLAVSGKGHICLPARTSRGCRRPTDRPARRRAVCAPRAQSTFRLMKYRRGTRIKVGHVERFVGSARAMKRTR